MESVRLKRTASHLEMQVRDALTDLGGGHPAAPMVATHSYPMRTDRVLQCGPWLAFGGMHLWSASCAAPSPIVSMGGFHRNGTLATVMRQGC